MCHGAVTSQGVLIEQKLFPRSYLLREALNKPPVNISDICIWSIGYYELIEWGPFAPLGLEGDPEGAWAWRKEVLLMPGHT